MPRGYRCIVVAAVGWLILAGSNPVFAKPDKGQEKRQPSGYQSDTAPAAAPSPSARTNDALSEACLGAEQGNLSCDAIAAKAAYDQARDAYWQTWVGIVGAIAVVASLVFSALATRAAFGAVTKAQETLDETKRMNAVVVRPIIAIESAWIDFDLQTHQPKIGLKTRNVGDYTAHDWEWQPLISYDGRKSPLSSWFKRGVRGIDLPPQDLHGHPPKVVDFPLEGDEVVAVTEPAAPGLQVKLTVFSRCYDAFGNAVDDRYYFSASIYQLTDPFQPTARRLQPTVHGTQIEGQEDEIPTGSAD